MAQKLEIFNELNTLLSDYDIVLIDTAAGISSNVLYFNASANEIMVVVTPEPTSITDAYALMKILSVKYQEKHFRLIVNLANNVKEADEVSREAISQLFENEPDAKTVMKWKVDPRGRWRRFTPGRCAEFLRVLARLVPVFFFLAKS